MSPIARRNLCWIALAFALWAFVGIFVMMLAGCHGAAEKAADLHDAGHASTSRITASNAATDAHLVAIQQDAAAQRQVIADCLKLPSVPPFVQVALAKLDTHAAAIQDHATAARKETAVVATETPKVEKDLDQLKSAVDDAVNEQRKRDEWWGKIIVSVSFGVIAGLAFERATHLTYLPGILFGLFVGGITYAVFGKVLALISGILPVVFYASVVAGVTGLCFYVFKRARAGGWAGLVRNVELIVPTAAGVAKPNP